jgi:hypothetical protein
MKSNWLAGLIVAASVSAAHAATFVSQTQEYSPPNDNFAQAQALPDSTYATLGNIYYATRELGEAKYATASLGRTVWYKFTATKTGRAVALLTTADMDTAPLQMQAFSGSAVASLTRLAKVQVAGTDASNSGSLAFSTVAGTTYYLQVDSAAQTYSLDGDFLIAIQQFGASGGLAALTYRPALIEDQSSDEFKVLVANGFKSKVDLQSGISSIGAQLDVTSTATTFAAGRTGWFTVADNSDSSITGIASGNLQITAFSTATSAYMGIRAIPLKLFQRDYNYRPSLLVRFAKPVQGVARSQRFSSTVNIKNTSATAAQYCRFIEDDAAYALNWNENLATGKLGRTNALFTLAGGATKKFTVSATTASSSADDNEISVVCSNYYATINEDNLASMGATGQFGKYAAVTMAFPAANTFQQIAIPDFNTKKVVVAITNTGDYSGYFKIDADSTNSNVSMDSICVSNSKGTCTGTSDSSSVNADLANGETGYVTLTINRKNATDVGLIYVEVTRDDEPQSSEAGFSGFEVTE